MLAARLMAHSSSPLVLTLTVLHPSTLSALSYRAIDILEILVHRAESSTTLLPLFLPLLR